MVKQQIIVARYSTMALNNADGSSGQWNIAIATAVIFS